MNSEDYLIDVMDIEKTIEQKIVIPLRYLFSLAKRFKYDEDQNKTRVMIGVDYPRTDIPLKVPQICVGGITYSFDMEHTLYKNYMEDIVNEDGIHIGERQINQLPFTVQLNCYGERNVSRDLANAALSNITFIGRELFHKVGVRIMRADKGNTTPYAQFPKYFTTVVSCNGVMGWTGVNKALDVSKLNILRDIQIKPHVN